MTPFIESLLENDDDFIAKRGGDTITFTPLDTSEDALESFQETAEQLIANEGDGYEIDPEPRRTRDHDGVYVDKIVVQLEG